jgi:hypothetical protein
MVMTLRQIYDQAFQEGRRAYLAEPPSYVNPHDGLLHPGDAIRKRAWAAGFEDGMVWLATRD